ncbi:6-carboxytetrahydropterin synthase [Streptomyces sp. SID13031]|uniref:6-pyruvoyl trahydropterin synthase family protein n=1 Tax=Streptomyces sp. SID13031 TaxID=2706046 RepID=UPI0031BA6EF0
MTVRHNFETAHRIPVLGGKCQNLHGHSWWCEITVSASETADGTVIEFGVLKREIRAWIDSWLDHGAMLGYSDPLYTALSAEGCKVFRFGAGAASSPPERYALDLAWPTVENVAQLLANVARDIITSVPHAASSWLSAVKVNETHVNAASWTAPLRNSMHNEQRNQINRNQLWP